VHPGNSVSKIPYISTPAEKFLCRNCTFAPRLQGQRTADLPVNQFHGPLGNSGFVARGFTATFHPLKFPSGRDLLQCTRRAIASTGAGEPLYVTYEHYLENWKSGS